MIVALKSVHLHHEKNTHHFAVFILHVNSFFSKS